MLQASTYHPVPNESGRPVAQGRLPAHIAGRVAHALVSILEQQQRQQLPGLSRAVEGADPRVVQVAGYGWVCVAGIASSISPSHTSSIKS